MARKIVRKAYIVKGELSPKLAHEIFELFPMSLYEKSGPDKLGDGLKPETQVDVPDGHFSLEPSTPAAQAWVKEKFPDAREVSVYWYPDL